MKICYFPEDLKAFVIDAILLDESESVSCHISGEIEHVISATAYNDGYYIELVALINGVDEEIKETCFVDIGKEKEIPTVIEYLTNCI